MTLSPYDPTDWVDDSAPDIDAANLLHLENGVQSVTDEVIARLGASYTLKQIDVITADETYDAPAGAKALLIECLGGGGGGGATAATGATQTAIAGGGGGAAYASKLLTANIGSHVVDVGAGGSGGNAGGANNGNSGSDTSFKDSTGAIVCLAKGGSGGGGATANTPPKRDAAGGQGGAASASTGDSKLRGCDGKDGMGFAGGVGFNHSPGTGGASAGPIGQGGARGQYSIGNGVDADANSGAGGSGASSANSSSAALRGGNGGSGLVRVWVYV